MYVNDDCMISSDFPLITGRAASSWLTTHLSPGRDLGLIDPEQEAIQVLLYQRFKHHRRTTEAPPKDSSAPHAIITIPREILRPDSPLLTIGPLTPSSSQSAPNRAGPYTHPPVRRPSKKTGQEIEITHVPDARRIELRISVARSTRWGMQLAALRRHGDGRDFHPDVPLALLEGAGFHPADLAALDEDAKSLIEHALLLADHARRAGEGNPPLPIPILQNQRDGHRYTLWVDGTNRGSPLPRHLLIHRAKTFPHLSVALPQERAYATDRKPHLLLAANRDQTVRLYLPSDEQWSTFEKRRSDHPPPADPSVRQWLDRAIQSAENLRKSQIHNVSE